MSSRAIRKIRKLPVMNRHQRRRFWLFVTVGLLLTTIFAGYWFEPSHIPDNYHGWSKVLDYLLFAIVSYVVWHQLISELVAWYITSTMTKPQRVTPEAGLKVAFISTFVPGKEPYDMLERNLRGMVGAEHVHDTWILDEGNDETAKALCLKYGAKHFSRKDIERYNQSSGIFKVKTKGGNHNAWYDSHGKEYDIVAQIDLDFVPSKNFLNRTLGYFRDPSVAFVGTPQVYGNGDDSLIAQGAAEQTYGFYGPIQKGLSGHDMTMLIGANHVMRVAALKENGWYAGHITEDLLTGMNLHARQWKSVYVPEVLAIGEGPTTWEAYFSQQMRWAYGCIHVLFHHSFGLFKSMSRRHRFIYFMMQQHYFSGLTMVLGTILLTLYFLLGISSANMNALPMLLLYIPLVIWQFIFVLWQQKFTVRPRYESGFHLKGKIVLLAAAPIYFMALVGVLRGKKLSFKVTPKGEGVAASTPLVLFAPHFVLGTISLVDLLVGSIEGRHAAVLVFWAIMNTLLMYSLVGMVVFENSKAWLMGRRWKFVDES
ncbi:MAG TPA: glycosyltransferase family 2 protein [Candidatus Saccharimonadales bacterium]|nr:glycosyltransferase family 2 protein [Candidatus Saccharimonadales bacterium]